MNRLVTLTQLAGWLRVRKAAHERIAVAEHVGGSAEMMAKARACEVELILDEIDRLTEAPETDDGERIAAVQPRHAPDLLRARIPVDANASFEVATATAEERIRRATVLMVAKVIRGVVDAASARALASGSMLTAECDAATLVGLQRFAADCEVDEVGARDFVTDMFVAACSDVGFVMLRWGE